MTRSLTFRRAAPIDTRVLWPVLEPAIRAGETYALPSDMRADDAVAYWTAQEAWLVSDATPVGTYYLRPNQLGPGDHVCNAGFVTAPAARGRGVARAMLEHALDRARMRGFLAMQFNCVVASNVGAIAIWQEYGFDIVGRVPQAFRHPREGLVDALVMHRLL